MAYYGATHLNTTSFVQTTSCSRKLIFLMSSGKWTLSLATRGSAKKDSDISHTAKEEINCFNSLER